MCVVAGYIWKKHVHDQDSSQTLKGSVEQESMRLCEVKKRHLQKCKSGTEIATREK